MLRRSFITAALAACTVVPILAQERATIVLTNGQRYSGVLTYPRGDNSIVDDRLHLAASGEQSFPISDVAVIDFAGGTPPATEVRALPEGGGVMIMRDGAAVRGNLHNIIRGGVVQWVNEGGERRNYDGSLVRRLYTQLRQCPRRSFEERRPIVGTSGGSGLSAASVRVNGNEQWVDTGIDVRRGDRIQLNASGQIQYAPGARTANANGQRAGRERRVSGADDGRRRPDCQSGRQRSVCGGRRFAGVHDAGRRPLVPRHQRRRRQRQQRSLRGGDPTKVAFDVAGDKPKARQFAGPGPWARALHGVGLEGTMAKYGRKASQKVERAMRERKRGTLRSGRSEKRVTSRKQAIAIGLSEARRAGAKVPKKRASGGRKRKGGGRKRKAGGGRR